jgi:hypothetical protein
MKHKQNLNTENCSSTRNKQTYVKRRKYSTALMITVLLFLWDVTQTAQIARKFTLKQIHSLLNVHHIRPECCH